MISIPPSHPRAESLIIRERIIEYCKKNVVAFAGLIAHGRGEAFDYLIGEKTIPPAEVAITASAASLLLAEHAVISVNGNTAALIPDKMVELANVANILMEVNLFYRSSTREVAIKKVLEENGAKNILGTTKSASETLKGLESERRKVDTRGIGKADLVIVPLEDGDRTEALIKLGKKVIAIDLNPLSRTARVATISIIDNVIRVFPVLIKEIQRLKNESKDKLKKILAKYDNKEILNKSLMYITQRLNVLSKKGISLDPDKF